jgi:iron(III) transport system substrate-binding protein
MRRPINRRLFAIGAAGAAFCFACAPRQGPARYVNIYSARHYQADRTLYAAFTARSGIEVRVLPANGDQLLERLKIEGDATEADLIVAADAGNLWRLEDAGLLQAVKTPALEAAVPANLHDPDGYWWAFSRRARVIVYNKAALKAEDVDSMDKLASPALRGAVCARSSTNVYNLSLLASRIERLGADNARAWARGVRDNMARDPQGADTDQINAVAAGECKAAIVNHYYLVRMQTSDDPAQRAVAEKVGLVFPDQAGAGAHVNISGAGVSAYAKRKAEAVELLEFLVGDEAQHLLAPVNVEYPIRDTIEAAPALVALGPFKQESVPLDALGRHQVEAARIFEEVGWR